LGGKGGPREAAFFARDLSRMKRKRRAQLGVVRAFEKRKEKRGFAAIYAFAQGEANLSWTEKKGGRKGLKMSLFRLLSAGEAREKKKGDGREALFLFNYFHSKRKKKRGGREAKLKEPYLQRRDQSTQK